MQKTGKIDGRVVTERRAPKDSFVGQQMSTPCDELHPCVLQDLWTRERFSHHYGWFRVICRGRKMYWTCWNVCSWKLVASVWLVYCYILNCT